MLRNISEALGLRHRLGPPESLTGSGRRGPEPVATDAKRCNAILTAHLTPTLQARPPVDHAHALLAWLQGPGGRSGTILATELAAIHGDLCFELDWEIAGWVAVGRELRRLIGTSKEYARRDGRRVCVYRIPPVREHKPNALVT